MQGIILKKNPFSEGNEIVTMFTRELGKVRAVARAVRSSKSRLAFGVQSLFLSDIDLVEGKKLWTIKGVRPIQTFKNLRQSEAAIFAGLYGAEFILKSTADEHPNPGLFDYFLKFLEHLDAASPEGKHLCADLFVLHGLALAGYGLNYEKCAVCGKALTNETKSFFSNRKSGFVCSQCALNTADANEIPIEVRAALSLIKPEDFAEADQARVPQKILHRFVESFTSYILERNLSSGRYLV